MTSQHQHRALQARQRLQPACSSRARRAEVACKSQDLQVRLEAADKEQGLRV